MGNRFVKRTQEQIEKDFWDRVSQLGPFSCWNWLGYKRVTGHGQVKVYGKNEDTHRYAYRLTKGEIPEGLVVRHKCDNPSCCNPNHLEVGTHQDNVADRVLRNRSAVGVSNGNSKLNPDKIRDIRTRLLDGQTKTQVAKIYMVDPSCIKSIETGRNWSHVI